MGEIFESRIESNIASVIRADKVALQKAMKEVVVGRAKWGKGRIRRAIKEAGYGARMGNSVRMKSFDNPDGATAIIFSTAKVKHAGGVFDLLALFQKDLTIRAVNGSFLAVPNTKVVGKTGRGRYLTPSDFPDHFFVAEMHDVYSGRLAAKDDPAGPTYFWLFRVSRQRGRLDLRALRAELSLSLSDRILTVWRSRRARIALQVLAA